MWKKHCKHYTSRGVMKHYANGADFAMDIGVPVEALVQMHNQHFTATKNTEGDPDGGSFPAYPDDKSWDKYRKADAELKEFGPVVFASGGYGADFGSDSLVAKYRPDLLHLPTTNGEHCTGDGIKMGAEVGGATIDLEWVQVHPTGLVKPDDADAKVHCFIL